MISNRWRTMLLMIATVAAMVCRCSGPTNAGSETTSGVEIAVEGLDINGKTAAGATVMIFDTQYVAGSIRMFSDTAMADENGIVAFNNLPAGRYNLFVYSDKGGAIVPGIPVGIQNNALYADTESFTQLRTVSGSVTLQGQPGPHSQVFISGSPYLEETDAQGNFSFSGIPEGVYTITVHPLTETDSGNKYINVDLSVTRDTLVNVTIELSQ
jgi:hypothetical protein